jgi:hypothetical protein
MPHARLPDLWSLRWSDLDPARREFEPDFAEVFALVRALSPAGVMPSPGAGRAVIDIWLGRMTAALVERLGVWVVGWRHTVAVEDHEDRGRVPVWRAVDLRLSTPRETLAELAGAVIRWHLLLVEIATGSGGRFAEVTPAGGKGSGDGPPVWRALTRPGRVAVVTVSPRRRRPHASELNWADVDPAGRPFDPPMVSGRGLPAPDADQRLRYRWLEETEERLVDRHGIWVVGFRWSSGEDSGGPVTAWCCFPHSLTTPDETAARITAAVVEWHTWLVDIAQRFDRFLPLADGDLDGWERAVAHLITAVGESTRYDSSWYTCCETVLRWFLEAAGVDDPLRRDELIFHAISGCFSSWTEPSRESVRSAAEDFALKVAVDRD